MLLERKVDGARPPQARPARVATSRPATIDRRTFLKRSGLAAGAGAIASQLPLGTMGKAEAAADAPSVKQEVHRTVCTHCSVGCAIDAVVENGVWVRQEPVFDSPINLGAHCAKGASIREHGMTHDSHRLKYPMKLEGGKWKRISWDTAYDEISKKMLAIRKESGPDALFIVRRSDGKIMSTTSIPSAHDTLDLAPSGILTVSTYSDPVRRFRAEGFDGERPRLVALPKAADRTGF